MAFATVFMFLSGAIIVSSCAASPGIQVQMATNQRVRSFVFSDTIVQLIISAIIISETSSVVNSVYCQGFAPILVSDYRSRGRTKSVNLRM